MDLVSLLSDQPYVDSMSIHQACCFWGVLLKDWLFFDRPHVRLGTLHFSLGRVNRLMGGDGERPGEGRISVEIVKPAYRKGGGQRLGRKWRKGKKGWERGKRKGRKEERKSEGDL